MVENAIKDAAAKLAEIDAKPEKTTNWWDEPPPKPAAELPRTLPSWATLYGRTSFDIYGEDEYSAFNKHRRQPPPLTLDQLQTRLNILQAQLNRLQEDHRLLDRIAGGWMADVKKQFKTLEDDIIGVDANHGQLIYDILARLEKLDGIHDSRADNIYRMDMPPYPTASVPKPASTHVPVPAHMPAPASVPAPMPAPMPASMPASVPAPMPAPMPVPSSKPPLPPSTPIPLSEPENNNPWQQAPPAVDNKIPWYDIKWPF